MTLKIKKPLESVGWLSGEGYRMTIDREAKEKSGVATVAPHSFRSLALHLKRKLCQEPYDKKKSRLLFRD